MFKNTPITRHNKTLKHGYVWFTLALLLVLAGCGSATVSPPLVATSTSMPPSGRLTFAGSTTMQPLVEKLADAYRTHNADADLEIAAGGSVVGINAVQQGQVDLGMVSRQVMPAEVRPGMEVYTIAYDALVIIVHPRNSVRGLTLVQLQAMYTGRITNWRQLGGDDQPVVPVVREINSGTRGAFDELVLHNAPPVAQSRMQVTAGEVEAMVARTPGAIGYVGFGNVRPDVRAVTIDGVAPSPQTVQQHTYTLTRPLSLLVGSLSRPLARAFITFALSPEGQQLVVHDGWVAVPMTP